MGKPLYTAEQFIKAIPGSAGIVTTIAKRVNCQWHTAKKYIDEHPSVKRAYENECEQVLDLTESKLLKAIDDGDTQMIKYYLSTKGKKRGYVERTEHTGAEGGAIETKDVSDYTDDERVARITALLEQARARKAGQTSLEQERRPSNLDHV